MKLYNHHVALNSVPLTSLLVVPYEFDSFYVQTFHVAHGSNRKSGDFQRRFYLGAQQNNQHFQILITGKNILCHCGV